MSACRHGKSFFRCGLPFSGSENISLLKMLVKAACAMVNEHHAFRLTSENISVLKMLVKPA